MLKQYFSIFIKSLLILLAGAAVGFVFFYFFKNASVFIIDKFRILQGVFGIRQYQEGMSFNYVFLTILLGNFLSTLGYFTLGFLKASLPVSFITGVFMVIFLFTGTIRHGTSIPVEVILLSSIEMFYRVTALTTGEYINKNRFKNKAIPITSIVIIFIMFISAVFYELYQIF
jgi:restriction endonuclease S subunit